SSRITTPRAVTDIIRPPDEQSSWHSTRPPIQNNVPNNFLKPEHGRCNDCLSAHVARQARARKSSHSIQTKPIRSAEQLTPNRHCLVSTNTRLRDPGPRLFQPAVRVRFVTRSSNRLQTRLRFRQTQRRRSMD